MKNDIQKRKEWRDQLFQRVDEGDLDLASASKLLRKILGRNQSDFAELVGVSKKIISDLEVGKGNPTVETINKIFTPVGLQVGLVRKTME